MRQSSQIDKKASSKFWDRQTSLEREDMDLGLTANKTNNDQNATSEAFNATSGHEHHTTAASLNNNTYSINDVC